MKNILIIILLQAPFIFGQTSEQVYKYIVKSGIKKPKIVMKQILLETGHLSCYKCSMRYNNLLGFYNGKRYLRFDTWQESIDFYKGWQDRKGYVTGNYYDFLINKWGAPDMVGYVEKLKDIEL